VTFTHLNRGKVTNCGCSNFQAEHGNRKYSPTESSYRAKAANYKAEAKNRGIEFLLPTDKTVELLKGNCHYCGAPPEKSYNVITKSKRKVKVKSEESDIVYNGIDRVDNTKGYTEENCVSCCSKCNTAKLDSTLVEFRDWIERIYKNKKLWD